MYFDKYPTRSNRTLHKLASINKYRKHFTNKEKVEYLGFENFHYLCQNSGSRYTNGYLFATVLSDFVSNAVVGKSVNLLKQYELKVFETHSTIPSSHSVKLTFKLYRSVRFDAFYVWQVITER